MIRGTTVDIAVSGRYWVGGFSGSILNTMREIGKNAREEVQLTVYSFGVNIPFFLSVITDLLQRNIRIQLIINRFYRQPRRIRIQLLRLNSLYEGLTILDFSPTNELEDLHAKILVVDRSLALVGSPNISWRGYISNHELAIIIKGEKAELIASLLDKLARSTSTKKVS